MIDVVVTVGVLTGVACVSAAIGWLSNLGQQMATARWWLLIEPPKPALPHRVPGATPVPPVPVLDLPSAINWLGPYPGRPEPREDTAPRRARHGANAGYWDTPTELHRLVGPLSI